jgi:hypothetical protein
MVSLRLKVPVALVGFLVQQWLASFQHVIARLPLEVSVRQQ